MLNTAFLHACMKASSPLCQSINWGRGSLACTALASTGLAVCYRNRCARMRKSLPSYTGQSSWGTIQCTRNAVPPLAAKPKLYGSSLHFHVYTTANGDLSVCCTSVWLYPVSTSTSTICLFNHTGITNHVKESKPLVFTAVPSMP